VTLGYWVWVVIVGMGHHRIVLFMGRSYTL
jgi:hypothetical protein